MYVRKIITILTSVVLFVGIPYSYCAEGESESESESEGGRRKVSRLFRGSSFSTQFQTDIQYCRPDSVGDRSEYVDRFLSNTFLDLTYSSEMLEIGARLEAYENPLPGFESDYKGVGVPYMFLKLNLGKVQLTAGDFYEQFGSGLILRSYYERALGIDNALRGGRITAQPTKWMSIKALAGQQRHYWDRSNTWITGADVEINADQIFPDMASAGHYLQWAGSWVSKWEPDEDILASPTEQLNLPSAVAAFSTRIRYQNRNFTMQGEYAYKINDPSFDNNYIYRHGQALVLNASYSRKGLGINLGAKHSDNISFRSDRTERGRMLQINYLPSYTYQHTHSLTSLYPYATQPNGEVAFQADVFYKIEKKTLFGGKFGTDIRANFSRVNSLDKKFGTEPSEELGTPKTGTRGYRASLFDIGNQVYYQDINLDITHRFTRSVKLGMLYMNQIYNQAQIEGHGTRGDIVYSDIVVLEGTFRLTNKVSLRTEAQYLTTRQDRGDWLEALVELTVSPHFIFTLSNKYNVGYTKKNYLLGSVAYSAGIHRVQLSVGQQSAGITCVGGICRYVPESNGASLSYSVNFLTR